ncbi:MAG: RibD family protein [Thermoplasmata archaeon]|jgi:2,5-diamino-6-(ribosylamino)-4(3H)-pyrimidinone 5'-phosphate reductase
MESKILHIQGEVVFTMRPHVIINFAMSIDGRIALSTGEQTRLSDEEDMRRVHMLRNSVDAILVGIGTVLSDDPSLTVKEKYVENPGRPARVILDSRLRIPDNARVLDGRSRTIIYTLSGEERNINAEIRRMHGERIELKQVLEDLYSLGIRRLMVEGGSTVLGSFIKERLYDEMFIFIAPFFIGPDAPPAARMETASRLEEMVNVKIVESGHLGNGILLRILP